MRSFQYLMLLFTMVEIFEPCNAKPWPWTPIQQPFPRPVLYDSRLSNTFQVSVQIGSKNRGPPVSTKFNFLGPSGIPCNTENSAVWFNYTLVLQGKESKYSRHIGPFHAKACHRNFQIDVGDLRKDSDYKAYLVVFNESTSLKSDELYFSTTDVQWAHIVKGAHHVLITCHFTHGTRAKGCRITMQVMNAHTSAKVETKHVVIRRVYGVNEASKCVKISNNLSVGSIEVLDWEENGELGTLRVATAVEENGHTPYKARLTLFMMSAVLFLAGSVLIVIGILCKIGKFRRHFRRESYEDCGHNNLVPKRILALHV